MMGTEQPLPRSVTLFYRVFGLGLEEFAERIGCLETGRPPSRAVRGYPPFKMSVPFR